MKPAAELGKILGQLDEPAEALHEERLLFQQQKLFSTAARLVVSVPSLSAQDANGKLKFYSEAKHLGSPTRLLLNPMAFDDLRKRIREEQRARRDAVLAWLVPFATLIVGAMAPVTGLLAAYGARATRVFIEIMR